ncbi:MAG TPA: sigma-70 family RNA polymerase sigma factor [Gemmataceae bacterium]|nr:sigma-70 family RNA polymerase sigma factor [Gemmataceae bacterium]
MANTRQHPILHYLRQVLGAPPNGGVTDAELLNRFVKERDEAAFELLLWRHAAMVLHVCRQVLRDAEAVEDAFQATFLVFVRKAGSISRRESLGGWLYRVAYRIALKARAASKKRKATEQELDRIEAPVDADDAGQRELRRTICEEVNRLPAKYRAPIVACVFEGKTHEEAANQLGWPRGTVAGRLARARELLRRRLIRRGIVLTAGAFTAALAVPNAPAALAGLIQTTMKTAKLFAVAQATSALLSPRIVALAEGVLKAMYWTRVKIVMIGLLIAGLGGTGVTLWGTQRSAAEPPGQVAPPAGGVQEPAADNRDDAQQRADAAKLNRNMAISRLNLKKLALAMHNYSDTYNRLPAPAIYDKKGKALLSWRVELLPFMEEQELYLQFKRDEPWDSLHNKKLLSKMPKLYAPPGIETRRPNSTYYQVFVSAGSPSAARMPGGMPGMPGGPARRPGMGGSQVRMPSGGIPGPMLPAGAPGMGGPGGMPPGGTAGAPAHSGPTAAFVKGEVQRFPASFADGTSNVILIIEAGNPVPWTKPEDLHYAEDEPLPELGGLFPDVIHAAFADGAVHTLTKKYDEKHMRYAITRDDGMPLDLAKIEGRPRRTVKASGDDDATVATWRRKNDALRKQLNQARQRLHLLKEEREVQSELSSADPRLEQLRQDHARLQAELKKMHAEIEALNADIRRLQQPVRQKAP